jgi:hypothetical protein
MSNSKKMPDTKRTTGLSRLLNESLPEILGGIITSLAVAILASVLEYSKSQTLVNYIEKISISDEFLTSIFIIISAIVGFGTAFFIGTKLFQRRIRERVQRYTKVREKEGELFQSIESEIANIIK